MSYYRKYRKVEIGSGSSWKVKVIGNFEVWQSGYEKLRCTYIKLNVPYAYSDFSCIISDEHISKEEIDKITEAKCWDYVSKNVPAKVFKEIIDKAYSSGKRKGKNDAKLEMRVALGIEV